MISPDIANFCCIGKGKTEAQPSPAFHERGSIHDHWQSLLQPLDVKKTVCQGWRKERQAVEEHLILIGSVVSSGLIQTRFVFLVQPQPLRSHVSWQVGRSLRWLEAGSQVRQGHGQIGMWRPSRRLLEGYDRRAGLRMYLSGEATITFG